jgi:protein-L-isoaspartate(D-aspartate) O-methyltransferase
MYVLAALSLIFITGVILTRARPPGAKVTFAEQSKAAEAAAGSDLNEPKAKAEQGKRGRPQHKHAAFSERSGERGRMAAVQIEARGVKDANVLSAMRTVPRHAFVRGGDLRQAYDDQPLPIGLGQTISQPYIVAYMTEALKLEPNDKVLEIGTGSGYQAAVCAEIAREVYTIEIIERLAEPAAQRLKELGYENVTVKAGDGYFGWLEHAPFDAIIITAAAGLVPPPLIEQLKPKGRMILPLGSPYGAQTLVLVTKDEKGRTSSRSLIPVRFVPMTGEAYRRR